MSLQEEKAAKALRGRNLAYQIVSDREKLRRHINASSNLTEDELKDVKRLVSQIEQAKDELKALGYSVKSTIRTAVIEKKNKELGKKKKGKRKFKARRKRGGIGMYGQGSGLKVWR